MSKYRSVDAEACAAAFKALGNPHRLKMLVGLMQRCCPGSATQGCCVGKLGKGIGISASTLSHHVAELGRAGLLRTRRKGRAIECRVNPEMLESLAALLRRERKKR
jgi:ArsR family transcriptional regulator